MLPQRYNVEHNCLLGILLIDSKYKIYVLLFQLCVHSPYCVAFFLCLVHIVPFQQNETEQENERREISYPYKHAHSQRHMSAIQLVYMYGINFTTTTAAVHQQFHICIHTTWRRCAWLCVSRRFIRLSVCIPHFSKLRILHYAAVFFFSFLSSSFFPE